MPVEVPGPTEQVLPPEALLEPCEEPAFTATTIGEMFTVYWPALYNAYRECAARMEAMRDWVHQQEQAP